MDESSKSSTTSTTSTLSDGELLAQPSNEVVVNQIPNGNEGVHVAVAGTIQDTRGNDAASAAAVVEDWKRHWPIAQQWRQALLKVQSKAAPSFAPKDIGVKGGLHADIRH